MKIETIAIQAGRELSDDSGAAMPPIHPSTTFHRGNNAGYVYSRIDNPNRRSLESCLATLENGDDAIAFASGMAASNAVFQALNSGDHLLLADDTYFGVRDLVMDIFSPWGLEYTLVDMTNLDAVRSAIQPNTRLIWAETPSNPMLKITDIAALSEISHAAGIKLAIDGTWTTAILQKPLDLGADYVIHSSTKYLGGHSDLTGGVVISRENDEFNKKIRKIQGIGGAVPSPFDCWLLLRGIRTLPYRMRAHCENAEQVAEFLFQHPLVSAVYFPGLANHPGHEIAKQQMSGFGGMLSVQVRGGEEHAASFAAATNLFTEATSLGGVESLIEHRALVEGPHSTTPRDLLRISVGLEHPEDLIEDLDQALNSH